MLQPLLQVARNTHGNRQSTNHFSDIDLSRWKEYPDILTDSLWLLGARDRSGPHASDYHGNFVPQIANQVIRRFTKQFEVVVDLFSGMGTSLIECRRLGRHGIGVELQPEIARQAELRAMQAEGPHDVQLHFLVADSRRIETRFEIQELVANLGVSRAHHIILHPPYWDIIKFTDGKDNRDLANADTVEEFYGQFREVADHAFELLQPGRFMTLVIGDKYSKNEWLPLGFECMNLCRQAGFRLKAINVKDIQGNERGKGKATNLWKYRALRNGFYVFKHEYVMIFQRP